MERYRARAQAMVEAGMTPDGAVQMVERETGVRVQL